jgi:hypothetical protein
MARVVISSDKMLRADCVRPGDFIVSKKDQRVFMVCMKTYKHQENVVEVFVVDIAAGEVSFIGYSYSKEDAGVDLGMFRDMLCLYNDLFVLRSDVTQVEIRCSCGGPSNANKG